MTKKKKTKKITVPTQKQIDKEIKWLEKNKRRVPQITGFGDNNWIAIDAEISVLKGDALADDYSRDDSNQDAVDAGEESEKNFLGDDYCESVESSAMAVQSWIEGDMEVSPSENWGELIKICKKKTKKGKR